MSFGGDALAAQQQRTKALYALYLSDASHIIVLFECDLLDKARTPVDFGQNDSCSLFRLEYNSLLAKNTHTSGSSACASTNLPFKVLTCESYSLFFLSNVPIGKSHPFIVHNLPAFECHIAERAGTIIACSFQSNAPPAHAHSPTYARAPLTSNTASQDSRHPANILRFKTTLYQNRSCLEVIH